MDRSALKTSVPTCAFWLDNAAGRIGEQVSIFYSVFWAVDTGMDVRYRTRRHWAFLPQFSCRSRAATKFSGCRTLLRARKENLIACLARCTHVLLLRYAHATQRTCLRTTTHYCHPFTMVVIFTTFVTVTGSCHAHYTPRAHTTHLRHARSVARTAPGTRRVWALFSVIWPTPPLPATCHPLPSAAFAYNTMSTAGSYNISIPLPHNIPASATCLPSRVPLVTARSSTAPTHTPCNAALRCRHGSNAARTLPRARPHQLPLFATYCLPVLTPHVPRLRAF